MLDLTTPEEITGATITPVALGKAVGKELTGHDYKAYPWLLFLEQQILTMLFRPGPEILVVSVPPQSGKSTYCSLMLPAWYLGRYPDRQVINVSYNETQASKWGLRTRTLMKLYGDQLFGVRLNPDSDSAADWKLNNGFGGMMSAGIRGGITGNPGDLILLDDTLKGREEANSPTIKKKNFEEWHDSISTRFQENTKVLIVATRWAEDDLSGEILAEAAKPGYQGFPVSELNIKALAEPDPAERKQLDLLDRAAEREPDDPDSARSQWRDCLGRKEGEHLPGQHSRKFFLLTRASRPKPRWNALYLGTPSAGDDGMFPEESWRFWVYDDYDGRPPEVAVLPEIVKRVRVWDLAASEADGDWTVGTLMGRSADSRFFVLDVQRFRHGPGEVTRRVHETATEDGYMVPIRIEEERSGAGKFTVDDFKRDLLGYDIDGVPAKGDKTERAWPWSRIQHQHRAYLPVGAEWIDQFTSDHAQMDGKGGLPRNDDMVDTSSYAASILLGGGQTLMWDASGLGASTEGLSSDDILELELIRQQLGIG